MPKTTVSKDEIVRRALDLTRREGIEKVNARSLAKETGCSVQPIYSCYENMKGLRSAVYAEAMKFYNEFIYSRVDSSAVLQSMAKANVAFAKYETNLFKLLFFGELEGLNHFDDIYEWMGDKEATRLLAEKLCLPFDGVKKIYIMLIVFTHGVATMIATGGAKISDGEIADFLESGYEAFVLSQRYDNQNKE